MRLYSGADRLRLQMIIKGKQLGFTLTEIAELIGKPIMMLIPEDHQNEETQIMQRIRTLEESTR